MTTEEAVYAKLSQRETRALVHEREVLIAKVEHFPAEWQTITAVTRRLGEIHKKLALHDAAVQKLKSINS